MSETQAVTIVPANGAEATAFIENGEVHHVQAHITHPRMSRNDMYRQACIHALYATHCMPHTACHTLHTTHCMHTPTMHAQPMRAPAKRVYVRGGNREVVR